MIVKKLPNRNPIEIPDHSRSVSGNGVLGYTVWRYTEADTIESISRTDRIHPLIKMAVTRFLVLELGFVLLGCSVILSVFSKHHLPSVRGLLRQTMKHIAHNPRTSTHRECTCRAYLVAHLPGIGCPRGASRNHP